MKARMASSKSPTFVKLPQRMAWRVMMLEKISTMLGQEQRAG
jgi:hypothetical protein